MEGGREGGRSKEERERRRGEGGKEGGNGEGRSFFLGNHFVERNLK